MRLILLFFMIVVSFNYSISQETDTIIIPPSDLELDSSELVFLKNDSLKQEVIDNYLCCGYRKKLISTINSSIIKKQIDCSNFVSRNTLVFVQLDTNGSVIDIIVPAAKNDFNEDLKNIKQLIIEALNSRLYFDVSYLDDQMNQKKIDKFMLKLKFDSNGLVSNLETRGYH